VTVFKTKIFDNVSRGASLLEVILAISIAAVAAPFMYKQIQNTYSDIENVSVAQKIVDLQDNVLNFVRTHQEEWDENAEIHLTPDDIQEISPTISYGIIDKRQFRGTTITDIYLAFDISDSLMRTNQIAHQIGGDAAVVGDDGIAYGNTWAVSAPDFKPGNLIYRISHNFSIQDRTNFLHRGASDTIAVTDNSSNKKADKSKKKAVVKQNDENSAQNNLNAMLRNLNMGGKDLLNVGTLDTESVTVKNINATFIEAEDVNADSIYFSSGANVQGNSAKIDTIRVLGDISGFRNITANNLNGNTFSNTGTIIADRATVKNSVKIGDMFKLKSGTSRSINSFTAISSNYVYTPYVSATDIEFYGDFGLTVSGELLMSRTAPLKIGNWVFPSTQMPTFSSLTLGRAKISPTPNKDEFSAIMSSNWQTIQSVNQ